MFYRIFSTLKAARSFRSITRADLDVQYRILIFVVVVFTSSSSLLHLFSLHSLPSPSLPLPPLPLPLFFCSGCLFSVNMIFQLFVVFVVLFEYRFQLQGEDVCSLFLSLSLSPSSPNTSSTLLSPLSLSPSFDNNCI